MTTPVRIFLKRVSLHFLFQFRVLKSTLGWMVFFYIVIPLIFTGIYNYYLLWNGVYDLSGLSLSQNYFVLLYIITMLGKVRLFIEEGDLLFMRQHDWLHKIKRNGLIYTLLLSFFQTVVFFLLLLPILITYLNQNYQEILLSFVLVYLFKINMMFMKNLIKLYMKGWRQILVHSIFFGLASLLFTFSVIFINYSYLIDGLLILSFIFLFRIRLRITWSFYEDVENEKTAKMSIAKHLLQASAIYGEADIKLPKKKRFVLLRHSNRIFKTRSKKNILTEIFMKKIIRSGSHLLALLQITLVTTYGLIILPFWVKWVLWIAAILYTLYYLRASWIEIKHADFLRILQVDSKISRDIMRRSLLIVISPMIIISGVIFYLVTGMALASVLFLISGIGISILFASSLYIRI